MTPTPPSATATAVKYYVLADGTGPYLLARVRWPDVAQAITAGCRDWQDDLGLFDLPYDPGSAAVTLDQAASIAAGWGVRFVAHATVTSSLPPLIRRMPANWSNLAPAEKQAWSLEFVMARRRADARRETTRRRAGLAGRSAWLLGRGSSQAERRHHTRAHLAGRAQFRLGHRTVSADLVDISHGGMGCVVLDTQAVIEPGGRLDPPLVLTRVTAESQITLDVGGFVIWLSDTGLGTHFGMAFERLDAEQVERVQRLLATSGAERGS